jgi:hypothetical protein
MKRCVVFLLIVFLSVGVAASPTSSGGKAAGNASHERHDYDGIADDLAIECSSFMAGTLYKNPSHIAVAAPDGACGRLNRLRAESGSGVWFIESQRSGADAILAGICHDNTAAIERGLTILEWGFAQQEKDGSFRCPDNFHSTALFLAEAARAELLLSASVYAAAYNKRTSALKPKLLAAAQWMLRGDVEKRGVAANKPYTHRFYLVALALGEISLLSNDAVLLHKSKDYINIALSMQDPRGFNPEKGGYDSSYHAVGLLFACRYYVLVADKATRELMRPALERGFNWLLSRISPDGVVNAAGNTRTGFGQEKARDCTVKDINYREVTEALFFWSMLSGDVRFEHSARDVFSAKRKNTVVK